MPSHVIIDGNNLLHAMHEHAPIPHVARETMVKIIERWARTHDDDVTLVFDGPTPRGGLAKQMASDRMDVQFSAPVTADDVIVRLIHDARHPDTLRIVSSDTAIRHEARHRRCRDTTVLSFIEELFPPTTKQEPATVAPPEKPDHVAPQEADDWLDTFSLSDADDLLEESNESAFTNELLPPEEPIDVSPDGSPDKPKHVSPEEADEWLDLFGLNDDE